MNLSNIWQHPKTSVAGILLCIVTVAGVLSQQGVTLGNAGTGTVVALIAAIGTALLGLLSRDPFAPPAPSRNGRSTLGAWALISLLGLGTLTSIAPLAGCTRQQKTTVAQEIVNFGPALTSAASTVGATIALLDPADAPLVATATAGFDLAVKGLETASADYLSNPSQGTLTLLQMEIVKLQQSVNGALLQIAGVKNPKSQQQALAAVNGVGTIVNTILALVQSVSNKTQVTAMAAQAPIKLSQVRPLMDVPALQRSGEKVAGDLALARVPTPDQFFAAEAQAGF